MEQEERSYCNNASEVCKGETTKNFAEVPGTSEQIVKLCFTIDHELLFQFILATTHH
jgi:hypothetical protein